MQRARSRDVLVFKSSANASALGPWNADAEHGGTVLAVLAVNGPFRVGMALGMRRASRFATLVLPGDHRLAACLPKVPQVGPSKPLPIAQIECLRRSRE